MSRWMDKIRKKREERREGVRQEDLQERRVREEAARQREKYDLERRVYDIQIQKKLAEKAAEKENEEMNVLRHSQMEEAQRQRQSEIRQQTEES